MRGLVLAVFLGTIVAALAPAINGIIATPNAKTPSNVLLDAFADPCGGGGQQSCQGPNCPPAPPSAAAQAAQAAQAEGLPPAAAAKLVSELRAFPGTTVFPIYSLPQVVILHYQGNDNAVVSCAVMRQLAVLGECAPGAAAVEANDQNLFSDNPYFSTRAFVDASNPPSSACFSRLYLQAVLVKVSDAATLERVRTYLDTHASASQANNTPVRTFGELVQIRSARLALAQRLIYIAVALTLLVAGCSLAVAVAGGGPAEAQAPVHAVAGEWHVRRDPVQGRVPRGGAAAGRRHPGCGGVAYGISLLIVIRMAPAGTAIPALGHLYYIIMGAGLAISLMVILVTLPLLRRMTGPASMRFE